MREKERINYLKNKNLLHQRKYFSCFLRKIYGHMTKGRRIIFMEKTSIEQYKSRNLGGKTIFMENIGDQMHLN